MATLSKNFPLKRLILSFVLRVFYLLLVVCLLLLISCYYSMVYFCSLFSVSFLRDFLSLYNICNLIANFIL